MGNSKYMKALILVSIASVVAGALVGCGSSSDSSAGGATAGAGASDASAGGASAGGASAGDTSTGDASAAGASSDVDELCAMDCAIGNSATGTASCQSDDCQAKCVGKYDAVAGVDGCQAAFLAVLQCGTTAPAIAWSCYNGMPFPLGSATCLPLGLQVANNADCATALRNAD